MTDQAGPPRVLVAGVGNIFLADDGFGVEVVRRLLSRSWPAGVQVQDYGIRGIHLAYALLDGCEALVLIDAFPNGESPGTLSVLEPGDVVAPSAPMDAHSMNPLAVISMLADMGGQVGRVLIVGCEPAEIEERIGLSEVVAAAVPEAERLVEELVEQLTAVYAGKEN